jgi:hypothetical protein
MRNNMMVNYAMGTGLERLKGSEEGLMNAKRQTVTSGVRINKYEWKGINNRMHIQF